MAIFLIMDRDHVHPDPVKDQRGSYKRGMLVEVFDDDKPLVLPPAEPFYLIKVSGCTKAQVLKYIAPDEDEVDGIRNIIRRRLYKLEADMLPNQVKRALRDHRYYETDVATVKKYIRNLRTGALEG